VQLAPEGPLAIAGFSFGAFVASCAAEGSGPRATSSRSCWSARRLRASPVPALPAEAMSARWWSTAKPTTPCRCGGAGLGAATVTSRYSRARGRHFFHGQLPLLKSLVVRHLRAGIA
jgi:hypothetical protein